MRIIMRPALRGEEIAKCLAARAGTFFRLQDYVEALVKNTPSRRNLSRSCRLSRGRHAPKGIGLIPPGAVRVVRGDFRELVKRELPSEAVRIDTGRANAGNGQVVDPASGHASWSTSDDG